MHDASIFTLIMAATVSLAVPAGADSKQALKRAKSGVFDATAEVACAQEVGETLGLCVARAARSGNGAAAVVLTFPNGFSRILTFENGAFLRGNATMSGTGTDTDWGIEKDVYQIRVDDQRFELPQALIVGE